MRSDKLAAKAHWIWLGQRKRAGAAYTRAEFTAWYVREFTKKKWKRPHVARFDHARPYSFDNIEMQEQTENNRERNARCGNPCRTHRAVKATEPKGKVRFFTTMQAAADFYGLDRKTVWNYCAKRTKNAGKFGPTKSRVGVVFVWN